LIPPFFLALSLAAGLYFSVYDFAGALKDLTDEQIILLTALAGASILPIGFFITAVSILILHALGGLRGWGSYVAVLPPVTWDRLWSMLATDKTQNPEWHLYASATFDHELIKPGVHEWIQRRWTTFNLSVHSLVAVVLGHCAAASPSINETWQWVSLTVAIVVVFALSGITAWHHTMHMLEFQASRQNGINQTTSRETNSPGESV